MKPSILILSGSLLFLFSCGPKWIEVERADFNLITNEDGQNSMYSSKSGTQLVNFLSIGFKVLRIAVIKQFNISVNIGVPYCTIF